MAPILFSIGMAFLFPKGFQKLTSSLWILFIVLACTAVVFFGGGTKLAYTHAFYIPIVLAGISFNSVGGLIIGMLSGFILGPWMPADIAANQMQPLESWVVRLFFFTLIGGIVGYGCQVLKSFLLEVKKKLLTDPITELPNLKGLEDLVERQGLTNRKYAIVVLHVDHLKYIVRALGQASVEEILRQIRYQLTPHLNSLAFPILLDQESFALFIYQDTDVPKVIETCRHLIKNEFIIESIPIFTEFNYGVAFKEADDHILDVVRKAKLAAEKSKRFSAPYSIFQKEDDSYSKRNLQLIHDLSHTIGNKKLQLFYQPKIDLKTGAVIGVEALSRWNHPQFGAIPPNEFINLIEGTLLINNYTKWMIHSALKQVSQWHKNGLKLQIALNFSMKNFYDPSVLQELHATRRNLGIPPESIEIEVTENAVASNIKTVADILATLRDTGIKIAVDDFGTGQSSLQYLFELPIDTIKIDKIFIDQMITNSAAEAIVRSAVLLAHELNLQAVAEGVESEKELRFLQKIGCDQGQGYFFAKPMTAEFLTQWISARESQNAKS